MASFYKLVLPASQSQDKQEWSRMLVTTAVMIHVSCLAKMLGQCSQSKLSDCSLQRRTGRLPEFFQIKFDNIE